MRIIHINIIPLFKPGDPAPSGYSAWHDWAEVQYKSGIRPAQCPACYRWFFPQEQHDCKQIAIDKK